MTNLRMPLLIKMTRQRLNNIDFILTLEQQAVKKRENFRKLGNEIQIIDNN